MMKTISTKGLLSLLPFDLIVQTTQNQERSWCCWSLVLWRNTTVGIENFSGVYISIWHWVWPSKYQINQIPATLMLMTQGRHCVVRIKFSLTNMCNIELVFLFAQLKKTFKMSSIDHQDYKAIICSKLVNVAEVHWDSGFFAYICLRNYWIQVLELIRYVLEEFNEIILIMQQFFSHYFLATVKLETTTNISVLWFHLPLLHRL